MRVNRVFIAFNILVIGILACNMPAFQGNAQPDLPATITAQALKLEAPPVQVSTNTPAPPTETPTITPTFTPSVPQVSVSSATNCRTGPSTGYDLLWTLQPEQTAEVIGKHTPTGYWIVKYPNGQCWLWGQYATVTGNIGSLPEFPQPPTPTPSKPAAPSNFKGTAACVPIPATLTYAVHVTLTWTDVATNEEGYRIFRNDVLLATLGANVTSFEDDTTLPVVPAVLPPLPPPSVNYSIKAFNGAGTSAAKDVNLDCE